MNLIVIFACKLIFGNVYEVFIIAKANTRCCRKKKNGVSVVSSVAEEEDDGIVDKDDDDEEEEEKALTIGGMADNEIDASTLHPMERDHLLPKC